MTHKQYMAQEFQSKEIIVNDLSLKSTDKIELRKFYIYIRDPEINVGHALSIEASNELEAEIKFREYLEENFQLILNDTV